MAKVKLTESHIASMPLPSHGKNRIDYDTEARGLAVRITSSGYRSFLFCYMFDGRERRMPIVAWTKNAGTLTLARVRASELRLKVQSGIDPDGEKIAEREAREQASLQSEREITIAKLAERVIAEHVAKKRSAAADIRRLKNYVLPAWGERKAKDITRADVDAFVSPIATGSNPRPNEANHRLALVRKMFSFAVDKGVIDTHPCLRMKAPGGPTKVRERALESAHELQTFWKMTGGGEWAKYLPETEAAALRLIVLTGCRPGEATALRWSELDLEQALWTLPGARAKNGREHVVPLLPEAVELLRKLEGAGGEYVFPGARTPYTRVSRLGRVLKKACAALAPEGFEPFTPHDLRRTVETGMAAAKVPKEHRDRVLNHIDNSVGGRHYNKHDYRDEKRDALRAWVSRLNGMVQGRRDNVVPIRRREPRP